MQDIARRFPNRATLVTAGQSFQGRPIYYLRISNSNFSNRTKPIIIIDGAMHAREWIAPPTITWAIKKLTEEVTEPDLLDRFDWILLPVANPDGYEFSHTNVSIAITC
jgi:murein tripeptide amidase MpaA